MKKIFLSLLKTLQILLNLIESWGGTIFLGLLFLSIFFQVILRYVFSSPSPELFEIAQYSFIWTIFLGAPYARKFDAHIKFDILFLRFSRKVQLILQIVFDLFFCIVLLVSLGPVLGDVIFYKIIKSEVLRIPWTYLFMCFPIFMVLTFIHNVIWIVKSFLELISGKTFAKEVEPWD
ncbi:TRAP-type C4-dicarboxylate transport system, small permease component [Mesotoga prima MesG1.Ag.4.2]|jgi:TRAP-type C4-dicarboxylate transport system permease small subunit|uniref:TRAP-type C4-dicarboxylate transport system, small permease component n=2 Tax=Mesotoga prima TaxID=1184387 RepID=I2F7S9_9BACT|nr:MULTISPECIES: TRAP transporter small permease [Mesotoga]AFK07982.1 TRAP-type C4-dicarboxylate transport system, small permease component [Mesotoga prima MesG1.Ag.4.2]KUK78983.1 MAG: Tripartite ATP-independent periplasmic transporter DctQ component [Mesotoga prima]PIJ61278.1 TRAP C4-dicarboxylate transporter [Mesotoga sp. H07.pep.5.3]RLL89118.1 TRAP C4-dicarboxylate transporter [Mesotoga sp. H07pep.5.4]HNQ70816.1 TRAP transporter small permease [Mesotoga prima]